MKRIETHTLEYPNTLIVGVHSPYNPTKNIESYFEEFLNLVKSNGIDFTASTFIRLRSVDPGYFVTKGKLEELEALCKEHNIQEVVFSDHLSPQQERNLSEYLHVRVFDRTQLILEIFEKGAQSAEGKLQVELALLKHGKTRLAGRGLEMSQQGGRIGTRGPGETAKEKETQHLDRRMLKVRRELEVLEGHRQTQRKHRLETRIPLVCLIGYTNSGKSTILNALTKSSVLAEDKLFATLDTTTRELFINKKKMGLISDTVGFIQQIPHMLIDAFKSTLAELQYAHLLLQVVDISDPSWESHIQVVHDVLKELEVDKPMVYVFNKIDKLPNTDELDFTVRKYQPHVLISAKSKEGIAPLVDFLDNWYPETL